MEIWCAIFGNGGGIIIDRRGYQCRSNVPFFGKGKEFSLTSLEMLCTIFGGRSFH